MGYETLAYLLRVASNEASDDIMRRSAGLSNAKKRVLVVIPFLPQRPAVAWQRPPPEVASAITVILQVGARLSK